MSFRVKSKTSKYLLSLKNGDRVKVKLTNTNETIECVVSNKAKTTFVLNHETNKELGIWNKAWTFEGQPYLSVPFRDKWLKTNPNNISRFGQILIP